MAGDQITVREAVTNAIEELGGAGTRDQIIAKVLSLRPGTRMNTLGAHLVSMAVNNPSRVHFGGRGKRPYPYRFRPEMEILFRKGNAFERYNPKRHGIWQIIKGQDGKPLNRLAQEGAESPETPTESGIDEVVVDAIAAVSATAFAAESHLRDYLAKNLGQIEPGLSLYHGEDDVVGVEYSVAVGIIDLLAVDRNGGLVVIELKVGKAADSVVAQALRYRNWVKRNMSSGRPVRAFVIAETITDKVRYSVEGLTGFTVFEYEMQFRVHEVGSLPAIE
jgi:endonuclease